VIDPLQRWREHGEKPDFAGLPSFAGMSYSEDANDLAGVDVAIVGAPTDDLVSDRPGARFGPRRRRRADRPRRRPRHRRARRPRLRRSPRPARPARLLAGRGEFAWQAERGIRGLFMHDLRRRSGSDDRQDFAGVLGDEAGADAADRG
jgi:hypothetical protein